MAKKLTDLITVVKGIDQAALDRMATRVAAEGEKMIKDKISTSETGETWSRVYTRGGIERSASMNGRVWTGKMRDAVDRKTSSSPDVAVAEFGWTDGAEPYYLYQEYGFDHNRAQRHIRGMFALSDAADKMPQRAREIVREELNNLGL